MSYELSIVADSPELNFSKRYYYSAPQPTEAERLNFVHAAAVKQFHDDLVCVLLRTAVVELLDSSSELLDDSHDLSAISPLLVFGTIEEGLNAFNNIIERSVQPDAEDCAQARLKLMFTAEKILVKTIATAHICTDMAQIKCRKLEEKRVDVKKDDRTADVVPKFHIKYSPGGCEKYIAGATVGIVGTIGVLMMVL